MKRKIFVLLLILTLFAGISAVSASENISVSDDVLEIDDADEISASEEIDIDVSSPIDDSNKGDMLADGNGDDSGNASDTQVPAKATTKNIKSTYGTPVKYSLKLVDKSGKIIVGKKVTFKIGKKVYKIKTDSKGVATLNLNYKAGKYTIRYSVGDLSGKNTYTVKNKITMTILKWGNKGDVSKIKALKKNMPNNKWVKKAVKATKKGNPLLKFEGGKGKTVFITAGVHGNELSSQVAVMKLIAKLSKTPIKGTVYIIPFVNIKAISHKERHTGTDYNRVAHKSGTISNKIVKLVVKYKCDAYGDFHTSQPGGAPGKNIVMGSKSPASKSASLTKYIAKHAKVNKRIYKYAGQQYPGALADNVNKKGIPAVICEVVLPHNTVTSKSVKISYKMMNSLLKFNSII
jgi:predicted deacylase